MRATAFFLLFALMSASAVAQHDSTVSSDPADVKIVTSDIDNFWRAMDMATDANLEEVLDREYLKRASPGLEDFIKLRIGNAKNLAQAISSHRKYYQSARESTLKIDSMRSRIRAAFYALKYLYPDAKFPPVYFVIGRLSTGGTTSKRALLIGAEMYGRTTATPTEELEDWLKQVLAPVDNIPYIVAHELVHVQQKTVSNRALLGRCIIEGSADFIGEMISGRHINEHLHVYGNPRERELWEEFKKEMNDVKTDRWLYNGSRAKDRPGDLGYYIGYKIAESYYNRTADKRQAVRDIIEVQDFEKFLRDSGYESKFSKSEVK
ncbi:MAG TPA: DUF2268 domain-containing putative Zn-dependent protease [Blastocatellia bacterium]|jgi:hypothetical protein